MFESIKRYRAKMRHKRSLERWDQTAKDSKFMGLSELRAIRTEARQFQSRLTTVLHNADSRLRLPIIGSNAIRKPPNTDMAYRPEVWRGPVTPLGIAAVRNKAKFGSEITVFHDCSDPEITLRQIRNNRAEDLSPYGISLDLFNFTGSFLSLAIELPAELAKGFKQKHILELRLSVETEYPISVLARLNLKHGPNTESILRSFDLSQSETSVEFDIFETNFNEQRAETAWIDLIFDSPFMNRVTVRDFTVIRRLRAEV